MIAARQSWRVASSSLRRAAGRRDLSSSARRAIVSKFSMPAMSPTMTEGGLATWKVKEGQSFAAGDVLLEIETDKATMDVEAQEDGIMAKIVVEAGAKAVPVGKTIAMLAEEGDDISNVEVPKEEAPAASSTSGGAKEQAKQEPPVAKPQQSKTDSAPSVQHAPDLGSRQFPSVSRLLVENNISAHDARSKIKGTGLHGMITKGDLLAYLGKASSPTGSFKPAKGGIAELGGPVSVGNSGGAGTKAGAKKTAEPLTDDAVRSLIMGGLAAGSHSARAKEAASKSTASTGSPSLLPTASARQNVFDELLGDYSFNHRPVTKSSSAGVVPAKDAFRGLL